MCVYISRRTCSARCPHGAASEGGWAPAGELRKERWHPRTGTALHCWILHTYSTYSYIHTYIHTYIRTRRKRSWIASSRTARDRDFFPSWSNSTKAVHRTMYDTYMHCMHTDRDICYYSLLLQCMYVGYVCGQRDGNILEGSTAESTVTSRNH